MITLIVAHDSEKNIGKEGRLPWGKLPNDIDYFRSQTLGKIVVMGRKTYESIGKPLPERENVVLSRDWKAFRETYRHDNVDVMRRVEDVITLSKLREIEFFIIGGEEVYRQFLPHADRVLYTEVHGTFEDCDTKFPDPHSYGKWKDSIIKSLPADKENRYAVTFHELLREEPTWERTYNCHFI